ncbi:hypothetical protein C8R45DRAFT_937583 [Mycena sanguinolenta]|nr:hypothetical protein C8R45DRAFT_937583 [Mycena sanguinolenta]
MNHPKSKVEEQKEKQVFVSAARCATAAPPKYEMHTWAQVARRECRDCRGIAAVEGGDDPLVDFSSRPYYPRRVQKIGPGTDHLFLTRALQLEHVASEPSLRVAHISSPNEPSRPAPVLRASTALSPFYTRFLFYASTTFLGPFINFLLHTYPPVSGQPTHHSVYQPRTPYCGTTALLRASQSLPKRQIKHSFVLNHFIVTATHSYSDRHSSCVFSLTTHPSEDGFRQIITKFLMAIPVSVTDLDVWWSSALAEGSWRAIVPLLPAPQRVHISVNSAAIACLHALQQLETRDPTMHQGFPRVFNAGRGWRYLRAADDAMAAYLLAGLENYIKVRFDNGSLLETLEIKNDFCDRFASAKLRRTAWAGQILHDGVVFDPIEVIGASANLNIGSIRTLSSSVKFVRIHLSAFQSVNNGDESSANNGRFGPICYFSNRVGEEMG